MLRQMFLLLLSLQVQLLHQKRGQFIIIYLRICIPEFCMFRMGNPLIGDKIRMGARKSIADLNRRPRIIRAVKEQDGYCYLWQVELVESIKSMPLRILTILSATLAMNPGSERLWAWNASVARQSRIGASSTRAWM